MVPKKCVQPNDLKYSEEKHNQLKNNENIAQTSI